MATVARSKTARSGPLAVIATDGELLMRFRRHRDEAAFAEVVERHGRLVWVVCKQALGHHQDVEDAFQATFLILAQRGSTIRASESAAGWLYRVAQRTAIAARKRRAKLREEELTVEPPQGEEALPVIHDRHMLRVLMEELKALPLRYQTPLVMQFFEGQSRRAIAEQTDSTLAQIQGRLVRGKQMLRSRLIRRGVSLSLATGAVAAANASASAAVSSSLVAATAACSISMMTSGATGGASPTAVELSKQGLNAMWYASLTKTVGTVAGVLIVAGVLLAGQSGDDGLANVTVGQAASGVDLQATVAAVAEEEEPAAIVVAAAEPAKAGVEEPENYDVVDFSPARQLELERDSWLLKAKANRMKAKMMRAMVDNAEAPMTNVADAMLLEADASMAEAKAIELAREAAARKASAGSVSEQSTKQRNEQLKGIDREIKRLEALLVDNNAPMLAVELEQQQIELALLQRELEQLHDIYLQVNSPLAKVTGADLNGTNIRGKALDALNIEVQEEISDTKARLQEQLNDTSRAEAKLEVVKRWQRSIERNLEDLRDAKMQLEHPQELAAGVSVEVRQLQGMIRNLENALASKGALHTAPRGAVVTGTFGARGAESTVKDSNLGAGDVIVIKARGVLPNEPIDDAFVVESMGTVALGPTYGRVEVAGLSLIGAEDRIKEKLSEIIDPEGLAVQVTLAAKMPAEAGPGASMRTLPRAPQSGDVMGMIQLLRAENTELKKQVEELRKEEPTADPNPQP